MELKNFKNYFWDSIINMILLVTVLMLVHGCYFFFSEAIKINLKPIFLLTGTPFIFTENDNINCKIRMIMALLVIVISLKLTSSRPIFLTFNLYLLIILILLLVNTILYFIYKAGRTKET